MKSFQWNALPEPERLALLARPVSASDEQRRRKVTEIIDQVRDRGDQALRDLTRQFDQVEISELEVPKNRLFRAASSLDGELAVAIGRAIANLSLYHKATTPREIRLETMPGVVCERVLRPIRRVGLYVPAGSAPLPSTVMMLGVPALLAGCESVVLCCPPGKDGEIDSTVLAAAERVGLRRVFRVGGAQAVAAMAYGTESIPRCDKIFGPGNAWVTEAKMQVATDPRGAAIDLPAGPSEVMVIADQDANPRFVAADLLSQAEHGPDSQVLLVTDSGELVDSVRQEVLRQLSQLSREDIAAQALDHARLIEVEDLSMAVEVCNRYAPEHLILQTAQPRTLLRQVRSAGSIFLGPWSPESMGDYCSGTNHVLPTSGWARACSGLGVVDFMTSISVQELTADGLRALGPTGQTLARAEGLQAHENAITVRLEEAS